MKKGDSPFIRHAKNEARKIRKAKPELTHSQALELAAKHLGFNTYAHLRAAANGTGK